MQTLSNIKDLNAQNALAAEQREQAVQSNLARLLATENIHVAFRKATTASFNVRTRVLVIPIFTASLSKEVVQMLVAHEVGHALWTPAEGWHGELHSRGMMFKSYLNVVEDARIERKIKVKYPGVNRDFFHGYRELIAEGFFGDLRRVLSDPRSVALVDRINIYYKAGPHIPNILFTQAELDLVEAVGETETWNDVVHVTNLVWDYDKAFRAARRKEQEEAKQNGQGRDPSPEREEDDGVDDYDKDDTPMPPKSDDNEDDLSDMDTEGSDRDNLIPDDEETDDGDDVDGYDEPEGSDDSDDEGEDADLSVEEDDEDTTRIGDGAGRPKHAEENEEDGEPDYSHTDRIFREKEASLVDPSCRDIVYGKLVAPLSESDVKVPYKSIIAGCEREFLRRVQYDVRRTAEEQAQWIANEETKFHAEFRTTHERYITHLVREFELKRNAWSSARVREARSGSLNLTKMHQYKYNDDLFKKVSIVPNGKNHGMVMIIDTSGSMAEALPHVIEQAAVLAMFCRRVQIPFRVFGFTNPDPMEVEKAYGYKMPKVAPEGEGFARYKTVATGEQGGIAQEPYVLMELFSDRMTLREFNKALFYYVSKCSRTFGGRKILMYATPLNEAILTVPSIVKNLRASTKVDKVSVVVLTDGSSDWNNFNTDCGPYGLRPEKQRVILTSPWTGKAFEVTPQGDALTGRASYDNLCFTKAYIQMAADGADATIVGYHVVPGRGAARMLVEYQGFYTKTTDKMKMDFRNNKMMSIDNFGYAQYFILWDKALTAEDRDLGGVKSDMSARKIATVFDAMNKSRQVNRVFLTKFIDLIA